MAKTLTMREKITAWQKSNRKRLTFKPYTLDAIKECNALYNVIYGERSNGKTYSALEEGLIQWAIHRTKTAYIRRFDTDLKPALAQQIYTAFEVNGFISLITDGKYDRTFFRSGKWYFSKIDENGKRITDEEPFAYAFALNTWEHTKSTSYPEVNTIVFDEFLTRTYYLPDEFILFMNVLSTIIRQRKDVIIYMLGNTVNRYCPYFNEMGLKHAKGMDPGTIDTYTYGNSDLVVAVERVRPDEKGKESDKYFAFDNPKLKMITGGAWEIDIYPHLKEYYRPCDIVFRFFIQFDGETVKCDVVEDEKGLYIFICPKKDEIKKPDEDLVYSPEVSVRPNWRRRLTTPTYEVEKKILSLFRAEKVFYSSNEVGEMVRNYLNWCRA